MANSVVSAVRAKREEIWNKEPGEVLVSMTQNPGTNGSLFFSALYVSEDTRNLNHVFYTLRETIRKGNVELASMKSVLKGFLDYFVPWMKWLKLFETESLLRKVYAEMSEIDSLDEFLSLIEELTLYFAQLNSWADARMPWAQLVQTYEKAHA